MNEYLAIDNGGYLYKQRINCNVAGCFPENLRWCLVEQVCQINKVLGLDIVSCKNLPFQYALCYANCLKLYTVDIQLLLHRLYCTPEIYIYVKLHNCT